jgi:hypothetical protein
MITEAEDDRVQGLRGRKGNPRPKTRFDFAFTGLIQCGDCGSMVTAEDKHQVICGNCRFKFAHRNREACPRCKIPIDQMTQPNFLQYTYYHCTRSQNRRCAQKSVTANELEKQIADYLGRIQISERFKTWDIKYLHEHHEKEEKCRNDAILAQQKSMGANASKRSRRNPN